MSQGHIVVLGSSVVDQTFGVETLPLPGESAVAHDVLRSLGGKGANQAVAARRLGVPVVFVGRVGDDPGGRDTKEDLLRYGVEVRLAVSEGVPTGHAAVIVDAEGENQIAVHLGANAHLTTDDVEAARDVIVPAAVFVSQFEIPLDAIRVGAAIAGENEDTVKILNAAPCLPDAAEVLPAFDVAVLNRVEAERLAGVGIATMDDAMAALRGIAGLGVTDPIVTLGAAGAVCFDRGRPIHVAAPRVEAVDTTGGGDAFVGALAVFLREEQEMPDAVQNAGRYAALAVMQPGTRAAYADRQAFEAAFADADDRVR